MNDHIREDKAAVAAEIKDIGNAVATLLPQGWQRAVLGCFYRVEDDIPILQLWYRKAGSEDYADFMDELWESDEDDSSMPQIQAACDRLHALCKQSGDDWTSFTFILSNRGEFKSEFGYDPIRETGRRFFLEWRTKHF